MKGRLTISIDEDLIQKIRVLMRSEHIFRNKSHIVEYAVQELLKRKEVRA